jgi:hypothetical protein
MSIRYYDGWRPNRHGYDGRFRYRRSFWDLDEDELEHEFGGEAISLNPFRTTYYLGRGRFGDNSRLHRGIMVIREREHGFSPIGLGDRHRRRRRGGRDEFYGRRR